MYTLVRRYIRTGIGFLAAGLALGSWLLRRRELYGEWPHPHLVSAHAHAVLLGFVAFLVLGVGLWIFPRAEKHDTRYRPRRVEAAYRILALSTGTRFVSGAARAFSGAGWLAWAVVLGGLGQSSGCSSTSGRCGRAPAPWEAISARQRASGSEMISDDWPHPPRSALRLRPTGPLATA